jgi:hypothetical protein
MAVEQKRFANIKILADYVEANPGLVVGGVEFDIRRRDWVLLTGFTPGDSGTTSYAPGTPGDWAAPAPTNAQDALDRMAAAVAVLLAGPIP